MVEALEHDTHEQLPCDRTLSRDLAVARVRLSAAAGSLLRPLAENGRESDRMRARPTAAWPIATWCSVRPRKVGKVSATARRAGCRRRQREQSMAVWPLPLTEDRNAPSDAQED